MNKNDRMAMMAELPVHTVLIRMSLPMMISFFIQAMYNIVDSMFVAQISENSLTAVSLAYPMQSIMNAIGIGTGVGLNVMLARSLGEGNREKAATVAGNGIFLGTVITAVFMPFGCCGN